MMICVAFGGGGGVLSVVSVLCGAGGGLTVQPPTSITDSATPLHRRRDLNVTFSMNGSARPSG
jgi:hypothetical protein